MAHDLEKTRYLCEEKSFCIDIDNIDLHELCDDCREEVLCKADCAANETTYEDWQYK